jgi:hypothetical protein
VQGNVPPDPDYPSVYKRGKWDDIPWKGILARAWAGEPVHSFGELSSCICVWFYYCCVDDQEGQGSQ